MDDPIPHLQHRRLTYALPGALENDMIREMYRFCAINMNHVVHSGWLKHLYAEDD